MSAAQTGIDAFEQVRFAGADRPMQYDRVGPFTGRLDDILGGGIGHAIARPHHKIAEATPTADAAGGCFFRCFHCLRGVAGMRVAGGMKITAPSLPCLLLFAPRLLEQLRIDDETHLHGLAEHFLGGGGSSSAKALLHPFAEMPIGYANRQLIVIPVKTGPAFKPKFVAWFANSLDNGLFQRVN